MLLHTPLLLKGLAAVRHHVDHSAAARLRGALLHVLTRAADYRLNMLFWHKIGAMATPRLVDNGGEGGSDYVERVAVAADGGVDGGAPLFNAPLPDG